jgi:hypothetical protein
MEYLLIQSLAASNSCCDLSAKCCDLCCDFARKITRFYRYCCDVATSTGMGMPRFNGSTVQRFNGPVFKAELAKSRCHLSGFSVPCSMFDVRCFSFPPLRLPLREESAATVTTSPKKCYDLCYDLDLKNRSVLPILLRRCDLPRGWGCPGSTIQRSKSSTQHFRCHPHPSLTDPR